MGKPRVARAAPNETTPDPVRLEPVMIAVCKVRALAWTLEQLADDPPDANGLLERVMDGPAETRGWLVEAISDTLHEELKAIESAYRQVRALGLPAVA
jgi:hypothetical protein